jgi:hypothetical protein
MAAEDRFKELITADAPTMTLLTGGVYTLEELGLLGLTHENEDTASAFEQLNGLWIIKPCLVIRERIDTPTYRRADAVRRALSYDGVMELWFYQFAASDTINAAAEQINGLLRLNTFSGIGYVRPIQQLKNLQAPEFASTYLRRDDYQFRRIKN